MVISFQDTLSDGEQEIQRDTETKRPRDATARCARAKLVPFTASYAAISSSRKNINK